MLPKMPVDIMPGETPTYTYSWSDGTSEVGTESELEAPAGTYTLTVSDGICEKSVTHTVTEGTGEVKGDLTINGTKIVGSGAERDLPLRAVLAGIACVIVFIWAVPAVPVSFLGAVLIALFGFFFAAVSARMVGLVGSSNNPISGMTIATLVVSALVLKTCGTVGAAGMVASIAIGSVVCIVAAIAGDTAQDLKTGHLLGATPWKQQVGEFVGVVAAAVVIGGVLVLLHRAWGFGSDAISAPQATLMKVIVEGIMGGSLPWDLLAIGAGLAVVLAICRVPVMPVAIGIYLSIKMSFTIFLGGGLRLLVDRWRPSATEPCTLFSAGMIAQSLPLPLRAYAAARNMSSQVKVRCVRAPSSSNRSFPQ